MTDVSTGPLTLNDTRAALGDIDPNATNAGALRRLLGRGSLSTIQKHLDSLRIEAAGPEPELSSASAAPEVPRDLVAAVWSAAWAAAQARTLGALAQAQARVAAQAAALAVAQADAEAAQVQADQDAQAFQQQQLQQARQQEEAVQAQAAMNAQLQTQKEAAAVELTTVRQEVTIVRQELVTVQRSQELERAQHVAAIATLKGEVDRLVNQLADFRASLGTGRLV